MAQPQPNEEDPSVVLDGFDGMRNTVDRADLGPRDLAGAKNVDLDDKGKVRRRRGYTKVAAGDFHSLFTSDDGVVYGVKNADLGIVGRDYSHRVLLSGVGGDPTTGAQPLAYAQVGKNIYFSGDGGTGIIDTGSQAVGPWGEAQDRWVSPVVDPSSTLPPVAGRWLSKPPVGRFLAYFNGRIYIAVGRVLWFTELYLYNYVDHTKTFIPFETDITMIGVVSDGLYIGTADGVYFLQGPAQPFKRTKVMDSPVIPGSAISIPAELANPPQVGVMPDTPLQVSVVFLTTTGFCVGKEQGECYNLTEAKFIFPDALRSAALYRRQDGVNQYVAVNDSGGSPTNSARFGDFLDAQIIRGGASWQGPVENMRFTDTFEADLL